MSSLSRQLERWLRTPIKLFAKINLQIANKRRVLLQVIRGSLYAAMAQWCIMNVAKKWNWIQHQEEGFWQMARRALNWNSYCFGTYHRTSIVWPSLCNRVKFCNAAPLQDASGQKRTLSFTLKCSWKKDALSLNRALFMEHSILVLCGFREISIIA